MKKKAERRWRKRRFKGSKVKAFKGSTGQREAR
jgi:hypothetical protein